MAIDATTALYLLGAALIASAIRLFDTPKTELWVDGKVQWANVAPTVIGAIIAVPVGAWLLAIDVLTPEGFAMCVGIGVAGLSVVKALLNIPAPATP